MGISIYKNASIVFQLRLKRSQRGADHMPGITINEQVVLRQEYERCHLGGLTSIL